MPLNTKNSSTTLHTEHPSITASHTPGTDTSVRCFNGASLGLLSRIPCRPGARTQDLPENVQKISFGEFMLSPGAERWGRYFRDQSEKNRTFLYSKMNGLCWVKPHDLLPATSELHPDPKASPVEMWLAMKLHAFGLLGHGIEHLLEKADVVETIDLVCGSLETQGTWCRADGIIFAFHDGLYIDAYFAEEPSDRIADDIRTDNDRCMANLLLSDLILQAIADRGEYQQ